MHFDIVHETQTSFDFNWDILHV